MPKANNGKNISKPKVTVTVPTFNQGNWLAECLESIVTQKTSFPFEILVGDDSSTDLPSRRVLKDYAGRFPNLVIPIWRKKNIGSSNNVLDLYRRSKGAYIAQCDGDDKMLPGKLQRQADYLDSHPDFSMVGHKVWQLNPDGSFIPLELGIAWNSLSVDDLLLKRLPFVNSSTMFRKNRQTLWESEKPIIDRLLYIDRALCGSVGYIDEYLGIYRSGVGIFSARTKEVLMGQKYVAEFAESKGCNPESISIYRSRVEMVSKVEKLMKSCDGFDGFQEWNWQALFTIPSFRMKLGIAGVYLLRNSPKIARLFLRFWVNNHWLWKTITRIRTKSVQIPEIN